MARRAAIIIEAIDRASPTFKKMHGTMAVLGGAAVALGAIQFGRYLVRGLSAATKAAGVQEAAEVKLSQALVNTGQSVRGTLPGLKQYAAGLQAATGYGDELILENQALLVSLGGLRGDGLERATQAAIDLSAATGTNLKTAFELVGKAAAGETSTLKRYGVIIDEGGSKADRFQAALGRIEQQFGGQAAAQLKTYNGQIKALGNDFGDLQEVIGGPFMEVGQTFIEEFLRPVIQDMGSATSETDGFRSLIFELAIALGELLRPLEVVANNTAKWITMARLANQGLGGQLAALAMLGDGLDLTTDKSDRLIESLLKQSQIAPEDREVGTEEQEARAAAVAAELEGNERLIDSYTRMLAPLEILGFQYGAIAEEGRWLAMNEQLETTIDLTDELVDNALELGVAMASDVEEPVLSVGASIKQAFGNTATQAINQVGSSLVNAALTGDAAFGDMVKNLLKGLATAIIQALLLKAILGAFTGGSGFFFGGGGTAPGGGIVRAAGGYRVPGNPSRGDVVPAYLTPGEVVLNKDQQREIMTRGSDQMHVTVELGPNIQHLADAVSVEVQRGGARLVATELSSARFRRT